MTESHNSCFSAVHETINESIKRFIFLIENLDFTHFSDKTKTVIRELLIELKKENPSASSIYEYAEDLSCDFTFASECADVEKVKIIKIFVSSLTSLGVALFHLNHHCQENDRSEYIYCWIKKSQDKLSEIEALA